MKIRKLLLKNIGVFDDETIEFQPCPAKDKAEIHIFTGENGSGKTTILMALATYIKYDSITIWDKLITGKDQTFYKRLREGCDLRLENNSENLDTLALIRSIFNRFSQGKYITTNFGNPFSFAPFAYSGYRKIKDENINLFDEFDENPLFQALEFVKDETSKFTINQWLGRNLSKRALALEDNDNEANKFTENIKNLEKVIADIVSYEIRFKLKTNLSLVLVKNDEEFDFDVLPDGLKSLISWIGDLLMRLDSLKWKDDTPIFEREIILFLDEIEVHLHPAWQRKVLPVVQKLFKNSQIFVSTHSPFVVNSVDDAWIYKLKVANGKAKVESLERSEDGNSYSYVLEETFDIKEEFGVGVEKELDKFYELRNSVLGNGSSEKELKKITKIAKDIAKQSEELNTIIQIEIRQINRKKGLNLKI